MSDQKTKTTPKDRKPFTVYCGHCSHEWAPAYLPMEMTTLAGILKRAHCPMCGQDSTKIFMGEKNAKAD